MPANLMKVAPKAQKNLVRSRRQLLTCEFALDALKHPVVKRRYAIRAAQHV
jgi:hypothetical protein